MQENKTNIEEKTTEKPNSFEISINAKGQWSGKVKAYAETIELAREKALKEAKQLEILINERNKL